MKPDSRKIQLQELLVQSGFCSNRKEAQGWILAGKVIVDGQRVDKAAAPVNEDADVRVKGMSRYAGRGGFKLEGALSDFGLSVQGLTVLDAGASTGGFTDCLLQHGAARVYAVDVGYGVLRGRLRNDPRVVVFEKTNISDLSPDQLVPRPSLATVDLSYLSLQQAIPVVANLLDSSGEMLCLVKPLFEVSDSESRRSGRIDAPATFAGILNELIRFAKSLGFPTIGLTHSHLQGSRGTLEFFLRLSKDPAARCGHFHIGEVVESALKLSVG